MGRYENLKNKCMVCGKPCRIKYCEVCAKEMRKEYEKAYKRGETQSRYRGCNEDCANCPYPDCYKPVHQMKATREIATVREVEHPTSQQKMYTLCIGGYGRTSPNARKKFMF